MQRHWKLELFPDIHKKVLQTISDIKAVDDSLKITEETIREFEKRKSTLYDKRSQMINFYQKYIPRYCYCGNEVGFGNHILW